MLGKVLFCMSTIMPSEIWHRIILQSFYSLDVLLLLEDIESQGQWNTQLAQTLKELELSVFDS